MRWLRYLAVVFLLLEDSNVRGDFGIAPVVSGATTLQQYTFRIRDEASGITNAHGDITLDGPSAAFNEAAIALKTMYEQIVLFIVPIAQSIETLAVNDVGPVEGLFGDADSRIVAMSAFINGNAQTLLTTIQTKVSNYVRKELEDILSSIRLSLSELRSALSSLRTGVINARNNNANSTNVQNFVRPSMVSLVQAKTLKLATDLPSAAFSAIESARTINQANIVIQIGATVASGTSLQEMWESELLKDYEKVDEFLQRLKGVVATEIPLVNGQIAQFTPTFSSLTVSLDAKYSEINTVYGQVTHGIAANVLNAYKTLVSYAGDYIKNMVDNFYAPIEPVIKRLAEILVQREVNSDFCYETYYPLVEEYLFSASLGTITCLDTELVREKNLMEALLEINYELQFFLEDTNAYLKTCYRISLFDTALANQCLQEHHDFSDLISCTAIKEYATMLQILCKEVDSLLFRLWACLSRDTARFPIEANDILNNAEQCLITGPKL